MESVENKRLTGERVLYGSKNLEIKQCVFEDGESPLKECDDVNIYDSIFRWKYPLWYSRHMYVKNSTLVEEARSGIWYTHYITMEDCVIDAPKTFRRASHITLKNTTMLNALESMWSCRDIELKNVTVHGDYFGMNCENVKLDHFNISGNYAFDGGKNIEITNSRFISKDSFWNCENVVVKDSYIVGEYLAWNSKNVHFINCLIESDQGLCYIDDLHMDDCTLMNTPLSFEYCTNIDAHIKGSILSVKNPISGVIEADNIETLIINKKRVECKTEIHTSVPVQPTEETNEWEK